MGGWLDDFGNMVNYSKTQEIRTKIFRLTVVFPQANHIDLVSI